MALDRISYDIIEQTKELTQSGISLYYFDRLTVEANTRDVVVTPTLRLEALDITLPTFSTSVRDLVDIDINRIGAFSFLTLTPVVGIQWYMVEMTIRPLLLGVNIVPGGRRTQFPGRSSDIDTFLRWDIKPFSLPADARLECAMVRRVFLDIETGAASVTAVVEFSDGTELSVGPITQATRDTVEIAVTSAKKLAGFRLEGDFTDPDIVVYDVEIDVYVPATRQLAVG